MAQQRPELTATPRPTGRKAMLTAVRREGKIPAVLYGHGDPLRVADLTIPEGVQVTQGPDQVVVTCTSGAAEVEEEVEEEVAPAPVAEPPAPETVEGE